MNEFTKFNNLLRAVQRIGGQQSNDLLPNSLKDGTADLDDDKIVFGESGLFYVDESGVVARVIVHITDCNINHHNSIQRRDIGNSGVISHDGISECHRYHIFNCDVLERARNEGWRTKYKMTTRKDGMFYYRFIYNNRIYREIRGQKLYLCKQCITKGQTIFSRNRIVVRWPEFQLLQFLKLEIPNDSIQGISTIAESSSPSVYSRDWKNISDKFRNSIGWRCQNLSCKKPNLNSKSLRRFLHVHHRNLDKSDNSLLNLIALCIACHANQPNHSHVKNSPDYKAYIQLIT